MSMIARAETQRHNSASGLHRRAFRSARRGAGGAPRAALIGLADYAPGRRPTALQDAGLRLADPEIRRLPGDGQAPTLPNLNCAPRSGTFWKRRAMPGQIRSWRLYISGYGLQDEGETLLLPAGARIASRADLAIEGMRLSAYRHEHSPAFPVRELFRDDRRRLPEIPLSQNSWPMARVVWLSLRPRPGFCSPTTTARSGGGPSANKLRRLCLLAVAEAFRQPGLASRRSFLIAFDCACMTFPRGSETPWHVFADCSAVRPFCPAVRNRRSTRRAPWRSPI